MSNHSYWKYRAACEHVVDGDLSVDGTLLTEALINEWPEVKNE